MWAFIFKQYFPVYLLLTTPYVLKYILDQSEVNEFLGVHIEQL